MTGSRTATNLAIILPLFIAVAGASGLPGQVMGHEHSSESSDTGRGEAPNHDVYKLSYYKLSRMNDSTLRQLVQQPNAHVRVKVEGVAGRYSIGILVGALRNNRDRTNRLIERLDNTSSEAERKEIIFGLLDVHQRRLELERKRLFEIRTKLQAEGRLGRDINPFLFDVDHKDPDVAAFHQLRKTINNDQDYVSLLGHMTLWY